ncbi:hypothetical protein OESDEN_09520 [Oesophagostomum dentatum]|uniref:Tc1-like transposase DDE domain-containing protein n=1 Tax=Oesophagostomum dentatum TaxID=61180 RepID=A0A0B1SZG2_OESDE|nr:hypothetical protein OESDEN_09520 [Oesophagostomum dentatum]
MIGGGRDTELEAQLNNLSDTDAKLYEYVKSKLGHKGFNNGDSLLLAEAIDEPCTSSSKKRKRASHHNVAAVQIRGKQNALIEVEADSVVRPLDKISSGTHQLLSQHHQGAVDYIMAGIEELKNVRMNSFCSFSTEEPVLAEGFLRNILFFAFASTISEYLCGKTAAKNKGRRAIIISAITEECVVPGTTPVVISDQKTPVDDDYHRDMNHALFEQWLEESIPCMQDVAGGRPIALVMDNAPYHTRQLEKLQAFIASRRGINVVRQYAVEDICRKHEVTVIRLPPFHCFFNPIEMCWSQLKAHLCKQGRPDDTLEMVKTRAHQWMDAVPAPLCRAWFRHILKEEEAARQKIVDDASNINDASYLLSDSSDEDSTDVEDLSSDDSLLEA